MSLASALTTTASSASLTPVGGERAGPPEDCGGIEAFHDMLACIKEPQTELGREWIEWLGPDYNPETCDLEKINKALKKLGK